MTYRAIGISTACPSCPLSAAKPPHPGVSCKQLTHCVRDAPIHVTWRDSHVRDDCCFIELRLLAVRQPCDPSATPSHANTAQESAGCTTGRKKALIQARARGLLCVALVRDLGFGFCFGCTAHQMTAFIHPRDRLRLPLREVEVRAII